MRQQTPCNILLLLLTVSDSVSALASVPSSLQDPHGRPSPARVFREMSDYLEELSVEIPVNWDVYGDFEEEMKKKSFLRRFETEIANDCGMEDAVFMPSGVMAQSIALLIHKERKQNATMALAKDASFSFVCHETNHLILHEQEGYRSLLQLEPIIISTKLEANGISIPPMGFHHVQKALLPDCNDDEKRLSAIIAIIMEIPHREIGGKVTSWQDLVVLRDFCRAHNIAFHCDGARLFEATTGYMDHSSLHDLCALFDSVYISCYKGLGGALSGAFLLGKSDFCAQARLWLRRFGGNLYTLLPMAVAARMGYEREWKQPNQHNGILSFHDKKQKLTRLVNKLTLESTDCLTWSWLTFDPPVPETNMVHGYIQHGATLEDCQWALSRLNEQKAGQKFLLPAKRFRSVDPDQNPVAVALGYKVMWEWTLGQANGRIDDDLILQSWTEFCQHLQNIVAGRNAGEQNRSIPAEHP